MGDKTHWANGYWYVEREGVEVFRTCVRAELDAFIRVDHVPAKYATLLVECGYADRFYGGGHYPVMLRTGGKGEPLQVFEDTESGNRQAQALEDWVVKEINVG